MLTRAQWKIWKILWTSIILQGFAMAAHAAEPAYPVRPIRLIIPFPPGGSADPLARAFGAWFSDKFGVPVVADNRPGAGTAIAHTLGAKATPDGYTLTLGSSSGLASNPAFGTRLDYDPVKDFEPVGMAGYAPQLLVVHPAVTAKDMREFIELSKAQPDKIGFGSPGTGSLGHLSIALLNTTTGAKFLHVPYKGAGFAVIDLVGGRIQAFFGSVTGSQPQVASGKVRALATGHIKRLRTMPDVPAIIETVPGFSCDGWYGILGPRGMPAHIVNKVNAEMKRALATPEFVRQLEFVGLEPGGGTPQEMREFVQTELTRWTKAAREAGVQIPTR
jgi:tripartite-type tricarboxylate transporter receptor subunit TctC